MNIGNSIANGSGVTLAQNYYDDASHSSIPIVASKEAESSNSNNQEYTQRSNSNNIAGVYSSGSDDRNSNNSNNTLITDNSNDDFVSSVKKSSELIEASESSNIALHNEKNIHDVSSNGYARVKVTMVNHENQPVTQLNIERINYVEETGFALELRGSNNPDQNELLNDMMIGVNFEIVDDLHAIGLIGREQYVVRTANPLTANEAVTYSNESMTSFNLGLRYAPDELILDGVVTPYVQVTGGGLSNGFAMGLESGLMLNMNSTYSLMIGYGANYAKYNFESKLYNSSKNGINFGMRYTF